MCGYYTYSCYTLYTHRQLRCVRTGTCTSWFHEVRGTFLIRLLRLTIADENVYVGVMNIVTIVAPLIY